MNKHVVLGLVAVFAAGCSASPSEEETSSTESTLIAAPPTIEGPPEPPTTPIDTDARQCRMFKTIAGEYGWHFVSNGWCAKSSSCTGGYGCEYGGDIHCAQNGYWRLEGCAK
jgi:hypothetical protein